MAVNNLRASYNAPTGQQVFIFEIPAPTKGDVASKIIYLSELRSSTRRLQEKVNSFLTEKMEEGKRNAIESENQASKGKVNDEEEEENYGEEKIDED